MITVNADDAATPKGTAAETIVLKRRRQSGPDSSVPPRPASLAGLALTAPRAQRAGVRFAERGGSPGLLGRGFRQRGCEPRRAIDALQGDRADRGYALAHAA